MICCLVCGVTPKEKRREGIPCVYGKRHRYGRWRGKVYKIKQAWCEHPTVAAPAPQADRRTP